MKLNKWLVGASLLLASYSVHAGSGDKGNGGDAVVCGDSVVLLDMFEAQDKEYKIDIPGATLREKVKALLGRMEQVDSLNGYKVRVISEKLLNDFEILGLGTMGNSKVIDIEKTKYTTLKYSALADIDDSLETFIPDNCKKEQLVINNFKSFFPGEERSRFILRGDLILKMDLDNRAMTVAHESYYEWLAAAGDDDSRLTRYINRLFSENKTPKTVIRNYLNALRNTKIKKNLDVGFSFDSVMPSDDEIHRSRNPEAMENFYGQLLLWTRTYEKGYSLDVPYEDESVQSFFYNVPGYESSAIFSGTVLSVTVNTDNTLPSGSLLKFNKPEYLKELVIPFNNGKVSFKTAADIYINTNDDVDDHKVIQKITAYVDNLAIVEWEGRTYENISEIEIDPKTGEIIKIQ